MKSLCRIFATLMTFTLCASLAVAQEKPAGKKAAGQSKQGKEAEKKPGGQGMPMMVKASPEIQKLIKMFAGTWTASQKIEPSEFMPGGSGTGTDTVKAGPGGNSLLSDYRSKSAMGSFSGHGIIYWEPKRQVYSSVWCDSMSPEGCEVGATGKWEGSDLVFNSEGEMMGKKFQSKQVYTDIKPDSYTFYIDSSMDGGPMKRFLTITYTRKPSAKAAAALTKQ